MAGQEILFEMMEEQLRRTEELLDQLGPAGQPQQRSRLLTQLRKHTWALRVLLDAVKKNTAAADGPPLRLFSRQELSACDGAEGRPALVAVEGIVYDVGPLPAWPGGVHYGLKAGRDLTAEFLTCHPGREALQRLRAVGRLRD